MASRSVLHMIEEEHIPGEFGYLYNVVRSASDVPDRYPMNPLIAMIVDVGVYFALFVPPLFFANLVWLGMAPMYLAIMELATHSALGVMQWRSRGIPLYNPGLATASLLAATGICYIAVIASNGLMTSGDWW